MESRIPEHHQLRRLFGALAERAFTEKLGWPDCNVSDYISKLLVEFTHTDNLYRIKSAKGARVEAVVDLLYESEVTHGALFFFQAEDGIRDLTVTGVQTCALPI